MKKNNISLTVCYYVISVVLAIVLVFPFLYMLFRSVMTTEQIMVRPVQFFPKEITFNSYIDMFVGEGGYGAALLQTVKIVGFNMIAIPLSGAFVAYGFARMRFPGRNVVFAIMLSTMMIPGAVLQVPLYVMFTDFGWTETIMPLTLPNLFGGGAVYIFLIRQYMRGLPREIEEAGMIDGANPYMRFFLLILPLCVPVLIYIIVNVFNAGWGDFYGPLIYMSTTDNPTLAFKVFNEAIYADVAATKENNRMAAGVFMSILPVILFIVFQKQLIEGVAVSSLKG